MQKILLVFMLCMSPGLVVSSGYEADQSSQSSVFSNHGNFGEDSEDVEKTQSIISATPVFSLGSMPEVFRSPVASAKDAPLVCADEELEEVWSPEGSLCVRDGETLLEADIRDEKLWLAHLNFEDLAKECNTIECEEKEHFLKYSTSRGRYSLEPDFFDELARRSCSKPLKQLAGSKRKVESLCRAEIDNICYGCESVYEYEDGVRIDGIFEKYQTTNIDFCLAVLKSENDDLYLHLHTKKNTKDEFGRIVRARVANKRLREVLERKKILDLGLEENSVLVNNVPAQSYPITKYFRPSLVPYPVFPGEMLHSPKKTVELE